MPVTVYSSTDVGAPVLTGEAGSLIAVLDACLVNGYGTKTAAGWTKPFADSSNTAVYRSGSGSQAYFKFFDDGSSTTLGAKVCQILGYSSMSDISTGTLATSSSTSALTYVWKSASPDNTPRPWKVIATDKGCYIVIQNGMVQPYTKSFVGYFGDYVSYDPSISTTNFGIWMGSNGSNDSLTVSSTTQGALQNGLYVYSEFSDSAATHATGSRKNCLFFLGSLGGSTGDNSDYTFDPNYSYPLVTTPSNGVLLLSPVYIMEGEDAASAKCLGHLPGYFKPLVSVAGDQTEVELTGGPYAGKRFLSIRIMSDYSDSYYSMMVETTPNGW